MKNTHLFTKKLKELEKGEIEYSQAFFEREFGATDDVFSGDTQEAESIDIIRETSSHAPQSTLSPEYGGNDVDDTWLEDSEDALEGELAVDVFQNENEIIITSTVAGVSAEDLDIDMNGGAITIRGNRKPAFSHIENDQYLLRECYWGSFSRTIILPVDILPHEIRATLENGILTVILPKAPYSTTGKITVEER